MSLLSLSVWLAGWYLSLTPVTAARPLAQTLPPAVTEGELSFIASPDERWLAVLNSTTGSLDLRQPDGRTVTVFPAGSTINSVTWSPDSHHLLAVRTNWVFNEPAGTGVETTGPIEIWHIPVGADQAEPAVQIFQSQAGSEMGPEQIIFGQWSPDSQHLLFWLGPLSASILADGLVPLALNLSKAETTQLAEVALINPRYHSWAPDSSALMITVGGYRSAQISKWLNRYDTASGEVTTVISQTEQIPGIVAWSPRGDLIAYAAVEASETGEEWADLMTFDNPAIAGRRIYLLDPATGQSRRLNNGGSYQDAPIWSEDGSLLYYAQRQGNQLQVMAADPATGRASAVEGAAIPLPEFVGYYGQSDLDNLMARRPGGALSALPGATATPTAIPTPPSSDDLAIIRFVFQQHRPELGTLTEEFLEDVAQGEYTDFKRQDVDLTGDGRPEILVSGNVLSYHLFVAILSRSSGGDLQELFYTASDAGKYFTQVRATVDGKRVIADFLTYNGGTGYLEAVWEQRWIECLPQRCKQVWSAPLMVANRSVNTTTERNYTISEVEEPDNQTVQRVTRHFGLSIPVAVEGGELPDAARRFVGPDTLEIYRRTGGDSYQLESQTQLSPGLEVAREFGQEMQETNRLIYEAASQPFFGVDGVFDNEGFNQMWARVWNLPAQDQPEDATWGHAPVQADVAAHTGQPGELGEWLAGIIGAANSTQCRLVVQQQAAGKFEVVGRTDLPCTINFTHLAWTDVNSDGLAELLLTTIPPEAKAGAQIQRLYLYSVANEQLLEMATLDGFINGADGAGIRWENREGGFKVEAGLPLIDLDGYPTLDKINLIRQFQSYEWDDDSSSLQPLN